MVSTGASARIEQESTRARLDETTIYVHVAENHRREIPESVAVAATTELDPDRRILKMLGARGSHMAASRTPKTETAAEAAV